MQIIAKINPELELILELIMNKKRFSVLVCFFCSIFLFAGEVKAKDVVVEAEHQGSVTEAINYVKKQVNQIAVASEKRSTLIFLASLQEQLALFNDAQKSYAMAAGIAATDAEGMPKKSNEQLVLDAVRCALCTGDYATANSYLNSSVRNSKNQEIIAYIKLYAQWSALCAAETKEDLQEPLEILKAYINVSSMDCVKPVILLTLWFVSGDNSYSEKILNEYPLSTECAIVKGDVQLLPVPFWFFVPKLGIAEQGTGSYSVEIANSDVVKNVSGDGNQNGNQSEKQNENGKSDQKKTVFSKWQLGLFKTEANAKLLCEEVKNKGFDSYITTETRASGTTYFIVLVKEESSLDVADRLRSNGYDCYPVD